MVDTPRLGLPLLQADQALKHITLNEALARLDGVVQLAVEARDISNPPGAPEEAQVYSVGNSATGDWSGHDGELAQWTSGGWRFVTPAQGWLLWDKDEGALFVRNGSGWVAYVPALDTLQNLDLVGINTSADSTNKFAVSSDAALFTHDSAGSGDARIKVNKSSDTDTASHLFQADYAAYAEFGLTGDNDFHVKVSPDNFATSFEALGVENDTGNVLVEFGLSVGHAGTPQSALHIVGETGSGATALTVDGDGGDYDEPVRIRAPGDVTVCLVRGDGAVQNTNNSYGAISDSRLKQDIVDAGSQWDDILRIPLRKYRLRSKAEKDQAAGNELGVIAQEVARISPGLVTENADGVLGVKYSILYLKALGALQEAMSRIEQLEARINSH